MLLCLQIKIIFAGNGYKNRNRESFVKLTYIYPPLFTPYYPIATRMITGNLRRNEKLDVTFSKIPVRAYKSGSYKTVYDRVVSKGKDMFSPAAGVYMSQKFISSNLYYVMMTRGYFNDDIFEDVRNEYVMVTCINFCDLLIVKDLLDNGNRVVLGGPLLNIKMSPGFIREFLSKMGTTSHSLNKNLIIISGDIDLNTDLHQYIQAWKDDVIEDTDYTTIYDCREDFLQDMFDHSPSTIVHVGFNNRCWYGKCKFCTYKGLPVMDFLSGAEEDRIVDYFQTIKREFGAKELRFIDSYFSIQNESVHYILDQIKQYRIAVFAGILLMKKKDHIKFLNQYVNTILLGLETASDFALKNIKKGYTWDDIQKAVDQMIRHMDRNIFLEISTILDLPFRDEEDVKTNYQRVLDIKERLEDAGFRVGIHMNILSLFPNLDLLTRKPSYFGISDRKEDMKHSTGKNYLIHLLKQAGMDAPLLLPSGELIADRENPAGLDYGFLSSDLPVMRYDVQGNILPSDLNLMDEGVIKRILKRKSKRMQ